MQVGAELLSKTVHHIFEGTVTPKPQPDTNIIHAPKIFKQDCKIDWDNTTQPIFNKIRGLSPYPTAFTVIKKDGQTKSLKLFKVEMIESGQNNVNAIHLEDGILRFGTQNGWIIIKELQLEGKKRMLSSVFLTGFKIQEWQLD